MVDSSLILSSILAFIWSFLIAVFAIPSIIYVSHSKKLFDTPNSRTIHKSLVPRLGGLAIFAGFLSSITVFCDLGLSNEGIQQMVAGTVIIFFIGLKDDISEVSAFKKFFVQLLAAGLVILLGDIRITSLYGFLGFHELKEGLSYTLTFIVIIGLTNAVNLIDGIDGLAGTIIIVICLAFGAYFVVFSSVLSIASFCLIGSVLGFLRFNISQAKIFMGDTGSLVCGFVVAVLAIRYVELAIPNGHEPIMAIAVLIIPIIDTLRVFVLRLFSGYSPFAPDKNHLHHRFMDFGFSQLTTVMILALINIVYIVIFYFVTQNISINYSILLMIISALMLSVFIEIFHQKKTSNT